MIRFQSLIFTGPNFGPVSFVVSTCILLKFAKLVPTTHKSWEDKNLCLTKAHLSKLGEIESSNFFRLLHLPLESLDLHLMSREFSKFFLESNQLWNIIFHFRLCFETCWLSMSPCILSWFFLSSSYQKFKWWSYNLRTFSIKCSSNIMHTNRTNASTLFLVQLMQPFQNCLI